VKALVYRGPGKKQLEEMPKPTLRDSTDAVVRMVKTTICGTDLHILKGDLPTVAAGRILAMKELASSKKSAPASAAFTKATSF